MSRLVHTGHTLFEILLALGLSLILLTAVYSALDMHWRYAESGQLQTEQMQIARALFDELAKDLRSVVFQRPNEFANPSRVAGPTFDALRPSPDVGIAGGPDSLVIQIGRNAERLGTSPMNDALSRSDRVVWKILDDVVDDRTYPAEDSLRKDRNEVRRSGLVRSRGAQLKNTRRSRRDAGIEVLAEEVGSLQFRYFDGVQWFEEWNSAENQRLPSAVEITIGFASPDSSLRTSRGDVGEQHRIVVAIPSSEA